AAIALIAVAAIAVRLVTTSDNPGITAQNRHFIDNATSAEKDTILPDGSFVKLSPGARLSYESDFVERRLVTVEEGTVQFEEHKTAHQPFVVLAQGIATTPIGTVFSVKSSLTEKRVDVILFEGKVTRSEERRVGKE